MTNPIAIMLPKELLDKVEIEAEKTERSRLGVIRLALRKYFEASQ